MTRFPTLYKRSATGKIQQWTIWADGPSYYISDGQVGGKLTKAAAHTCEAKNPNKKNATTAAEQAVKEAQADWDKKLKRGYSEDINAIDDTGFIKPMKGDKWADRADKVVYPVVVQNKLNGVRCQSVAERSYSTGGETFYNIEHIREELGQLFAKYPEAFIDGEAFNERLKKNLNRLIKLVSVVIKPKDLTAELRAESRAIVELHVFDGYGFQGITQKTPFRKRHAALKKLLAEFKFNYIKLVDYWTVEDYPTLRRQLADNKEKGGEGLMVRYGDCEYKNGRSKFMLKMKHFDDAEYLVLCVEEGNADWVGCVKRVVLALPAPIIGANGEPQTEFAANIEGDRAYLRDLWLNQDKIVNKLATVEYQQLSEFGVPQIPWVRALRTYERI